VDYPSSPAGCVAGVPEALSWGGGIMKEVPLSAGKVALVDDEDYARVIAAGAWYYHQCGYGVRNRRRTSPIRHYLLHRFILDTPPGQFVDHRNGNGLDCRRANMRLCTKRQNQQNSRKRRSMGGRIPTSQYKGVSFDQRKGKWVARIHNGTGRYLFLGYHTSEESAYHAYIEAAKLHHGEFAHF